MNHHTRSNTQSPSNRQQVTRQLHQLMDHPITFDHTQEIHSHHHHQNQTSKTSIINPHEITPLAPPQLSTTVKPFHLPTAHIKRAVSNNLPCFHIKFDNNITQHSIPPTMKVARWIRQTVQQQSSESIGDFSILIPVGTNRYKFGVTSKNDFLLIWNSQQVPSQKSTTIDPDQQMIKAIGHLLLPITAFLPGLKLTYCSNCWIIGHTKPECKMNPRCRPHLSTSIECSVVYNYRITLKDQVKKVINNGLISQSSINQNREATLYVKDGRYETKQINGIKLAWGRQSKSTVRPQIQHENENGQLGELVCRTKDILDIIRRMELKMDSQILTIDILERRPVLYKESLIDLAKIIQQLINTTLEKKNKQQLQSLCTTTRIDFLQNRIKKKLQCITNDHQQQQTSTSPSLQPNSNRIQTKSTTFNNNANYDRMEQDSPISNESHDGNGKHFWSHLSKIYKPKTLPISKLKAGSITIADQQEITNMLYSYYKEQANSPNIDENEQHDQKIVGDYSKIMNTLSQPLDIKVEKESSGYDLDI
ncbi:unnamed protein product [Rotaria magnacalcarata]|uniref:Uncharacterized protein n=3 Tax=Rotaria magnacalcarata TaxID=392030 RepID=A0A8S2PFB5_9BILA|nr:unnamed protein product [Rotaria magnacalcarata]